MNEQELILPAELTEPTNRYKTEAAHIAAPVPFQAKTPTIKTKHSPAKPTGPPTSEDDFNYWRFSDLRSRNIVTDRADLWRKQQRGFPKAVKFSKGRGAVALFPVAAVRKWLLENMSSADTD